MCVCVCVCVCLAAAAGSRRLLGSLPCRQTVTRRRKRRRRSSAVLMCSQQEVWRRSRVSSVADCVYMDLFYFKDGSENKSHESHVCSCRNVRWEVQRSGRQEGERTHLVTSSLQTVHHVKTMCFSSAGVGGSTSSSALVQEGGQVWGGGPDGEVHVGPETAGLIPPRQTGGDPGRGGGGTASHHTFVLYLMQHFNHWSHPLRLRHAPSI